MGWATDDLTKIEAQQRQATVVLGIQKVPPQAFFSLSAVPVWEIFLQH